MSTLGDLLKKAMGPRLQPLSLSNPFIHIDLDETAEVLNIDAMAQENGALELPASQTQSLDEVENQIVFTVQNHIRQAREEARAEIRTFDDRLAQLNLLTHLSSIGSEARTAEAEFKASVLKSKMRLSLSATKVAESFRALGQFKAEHGLKRPANPPSQAIILFGSLLLALLVEAGLNTIFLSVNDDHGLLGGFLAAVVVAAVNIALAFSAGRFAWPGFNHKSGVRRTVAVVVTAAWVVFAIVWNFLAAHFRDAKADGLPTPETAALASFLHSPLALDSIYSWGLLIIGFVCAAFAASAAYRLDDPYPGYGRIDTVHDERCDDYAKDVSESVADLREIFDSSAGEVQAIRTALGQQFRESLQARNARETMTANCDQHIDYLVQCANSLMARYRRGNLKARSTTAPETFDRKWSLSDREYLRTSIPAVELPASQTDVAAADKTLEGAIDRISVGFEEALSSFETLDHLKVKMIDG